MKGEGEGEGEGEGVESVDRGGAKGGRSSRLELGNVIENRETQTRIAIHLLNT